MSEEIQDGVIVVEVSDGKAPCKRCVVSVYCLLAVSLVRIPNKTFKPSEN